MANHSEAGGAKNTRVVYGDKEYLIECWIENKDEETKQKYSKYLKIKDKENELKTIYDEIKLMMFNNKDVVKNIKNDDPINKLESYEAIKIETDSLLVREKTFFMINSIVTVGLIITLFRLI